MDLRKVHNQAPAVWTLSRVPKEHSHDSSQPLLAHSEVFCSGSGLLGPQFICGLSPEGNVGCSVSGPLSSLRKGVLTTQMVQFPKGSLTLVSSEG